MFGFFKPRLRINVCSGIYFCVEKRGEWGIWGPYDSYIFKTEELAIEHMNKIYERGY